jgi:hypothetical protein
MGEQKRLTAQLAGSIAKTYKTYAAVLASILRPFAQLKAEPSETNDAMMKVREIVRRLDIIATAWARASIRNAYESKRKEIGAAAKVVGNLETGKEIDREGTIKRRASKAAEEFIKVNASIMGTVSEFMAAYNQAFGAVNAAKQTEQVQAMAAGMTKIMEKKVGYYLARGYSEGAISRKLRSYLEKLVKGEDFIEINGRQYQLKALAENIARSELHEAYVEATIDECRKWDNDLVQFSRHDDPCELCAPLEGMVFSISGDDEDFPPLDSPVTVQTAKGAVEVDPKFPHYQCCLPGTTCEPIGNIIAASQSIYRGTQIDIVLANGARLSVTENHLLLTPHGFAPANRLYKGDDIFYCAFNSGMVSIDPDNYREPALIEQIIETLTETEGMKTRRVKVAAEDFHGDGQFVDSDVDIIWADGLLVNAWDAAFLKRSQDDNLHPSKVGGPPLSGKCNLAAVLSRLAYASDCIVGSRRAPAPFFAARPSCRDHVTLADRPEIATDFPKSDMNGLIGNSETLGKVALQSPRVVEIQKIVAVDFFLYHGPVYNLQTESSLYITNGILSSNCEHNLNPVTRNILEAAGEL